ncbi:MAG TPA: molybdopterin converting factor subunit 1 [Burkholderiaceae bacterium]|nr:molybdopterin converting factor subunit 1 [Burkholderiaceae bacterium]
MKLRVLYFAALRERVGRGDETINAPDGINSVAQLREWLTQRGEPWREAFADTRRVRVAVDQAMAEDWQMLHDGAEVAFFPPVTGG